MCFFKEECVSGYRELGMKLECLSDCPLSSAYGSSLYAQFIDIEKNSELLEDNSDKRHAISLVFDIVQEISRGGFFYIRDGEICTYVREHKDIAECADHNLIYALRGALLSAASAFEKQCGFYRRNAPPLIKNN